VKIKIDLTAEERTIIQHLAKTGGTGNVMEFLNFSLADFEKGFSIANEMQNKDLVKLLYSNFNKNLIVVETTLLGYNASKMSKQ
jgi:hypothetical protein